MSIKNNKIAKATEIPSELKLRVYNWLSRIGVERTDIYFDYIIGENWAEIIFILNRVHYRFKSDKQIGYKQNLKAIEIFIHNRVISIERGIENLNIAFSGYKQLTHNTTTHNNVTHNDKYYIYYIDNLSLDELKSLRKIYHPDAKTGNKDKFIHIQNRIKEIEKNKNEI